MTARLYIRPVGRLPPTATPPEGTALSVAGRGDLLFSAAEIIERDGKATTRRVVSAAELASASDVRLAALRARLSAPREPVAGLALDRPRLMGVVNVTPDSFSDGGRFFDPDDAIAHGLRLEAEGADILDIGAESTRPGAEPVDADAELARALPVLEALSRRSRSILSIDTRKPAVMRRAASAGAKIINDVSALSYDPHSVAAAAETGLPVILMHALADPRTMQQDPRYDDVVLDIYDALEARIAVCEAAGIPRARILVDPGIGFGKTLAHNLALIGHLSLFHGLGCGLVLGASRKSFIGRLTGAPQGQRLPGSLAAVLAGAAQGVQILRVHDVGPTRQALAVWEAAAAAASTG